MSNKIQTRAWELPLTNVVDKFILVKLGDNANDEGVCYPSRQTISRETGIAVSTISDAMNCLEAYGLVTRELRKRRGGANSSNNYHLFIPYFSEEQRNYHFDTKTSKGVKNDDIVGLYVLGYDELRKAYNEGKKAKSGKLFLDKYRAITEKKDKDLFVKKWLKVATELKKKTLKSDEKQEVFESHFLNHSPADGVAHSPADGVAHSPADGVAHSPADGVATIEPSYSFNHQSFLSKKNKKEFSFNLSKKSEYDNLPKEYQEKLAEYAEKKNKSVGFDAFINFHAGKGNEWKDWSRAYNTWVSNSKKFESKRDSNPTQNKPKINRTQNNVTDNNKAVLEELFGKGGAANA
jgi:hypothetical protein